MDKDWFKEASRKEFDLVLFWSLDRFSREGVLETLQHLQRLSSYAPVAGGRGDVTGFETWHSHGIPDTRIENAKDKSLC